MPTAKPPSEVGAAVRPHLTGEGSVAQRGSVTCLKSPSWEGMECRTHTL